MSRAFVKEPDGDQVPENLAERPLSPHPNFVTARGLGLLQQQRQALLEKREQWACEANQVVARPQLARIDRDLRYVTARLESARLVSMTNQPQDRVAFGAVVALEDDQGHDHRYAIVGEDEADPARGKISWVSPLARALADAQVGDEITWPRPSGDLVMEVVGLSYPDT